MNRDDVEKLALFAITAAVVLWGIYGLYKVIGGL